MDIESAVISCDPINISQRISENEMTIVRKLLLQLHQDYRYTTDSGGLNSYQKIAGLSVIPKPGAKLDTTWIPTMYQTVNFWCKDVDIIQVADNDETQFHVTATYLGRGLNFCRLQYTDTTTRILDYSVESQEYDFQVSEAKAGPALDAEISSFTVPIINSAKDPVLDGAKEVRAIQILKIKMETPAGSDSFLFSKGKQGFQNVVNQNKVTIMGVDILKHCGLASIKSYKAINPHSEEAAYYEVDLEIKVRPGDGAGSQNNPQDTWDTWMLDQGFRYLESGIPQIITNQNINPRAKNPEDPISDPIPLNGSGGILTTYASSSTRYWLKYQLQNEVLFETFGLPVSEIKS